MSATRALVIIAAALAACPGRGAVAEPGANPAATAPPRSLPPAWGGDHSAETRHPPAAGMPTGGHAGEPAPSPGPVLPGQDAFAAVQEVVRLLQADPRTDWSKVDLEGLRQHLIDMHEVTLKADAAPTPVDGGLAVAVTGSGRTLAAIQRMLAAWAQTMNGNRGWTTKAEPLPNGVRLTVTAADPKEVMHIRGLGFIGLLVSGAHQPHHLAMAKGEFGQTHGGPMR
jgi:hypothetical protein